MPQPISHHLVFKVSEDGRNIYFRFKMQGVESCIGTYQELKVYYHFVRENIAANVMRVTYIPSLENLADMFTKLLGATKLKALAQRVLY